MLDSLSQSLNETYERMLCNIDHYLIEDVRRILILLCFVVKSLKVQELIESIAVEIDDFTKFNRNRRLKDVDDIRDICLNFVDIDFNVDHNIEIYYEKDSTSTVRIVHFFVQEYLEFERIRHQKVAIFNLNNVTIHVDIAQICLMYLFEHDLSSSNLNQSLIETFSLIQFATMY